jgi:hypothetical protein
MRMGKTSANNIEIRWKNCKVSQRHSTSDLASHKVVKPQSRSQNSLQRRTELAKSVEQCCSNMFTTTASPLACSARNSLRDSPSPYTLPRLEGFSFGAADELHRPTIVLRRWKQTTSWKGHPPSSRMPPAHVASSSAGMSSPNASSHPQLTSEGLKERCGRTDL